MFILCFALVVSSVDAVCKSSALTAAEQAVLDKHNDLRSLHEDTPDLCYGVTGDDITFSSQKWAEYLSSFKTMKLEHSKAADYNTNGMVYGENLAAQMGSYTPEQTSGYISSTQRWYDEIKDWDFTTSARKISSPSAMVGHFTQVVWKNSKQVNCGFEAYTTTSGSNGESVACQYYPAGNYLGQYAANVMPLKEVVQKCSKPTITNSASIMPDMNISNGEKYTVTCEANFYLAGNNPTCTSDKNSASLSTLPVCAAVPKCSKPTILDSQSVVPDTSIGGGEAYTVVCKDGFKLVGSQPQCTVSGSDAKLEPIPTCKPDSYTPMCTKPTIGNASSILPDTDIKEGEKYTVSCKDNYKLVGSQPTCVSNNNNVGELQNIPKCNSAETFSSIGFMIITLLSIYLLL